MKKLALLAVFLVVACSSSVDEDGVPIGVELKETNKIKEVLIDGNKISTRDFLDKYCQGKGLNATCNKVAQAAQINSLRINSNSMPKSW